MTEREKMSEGWFRDCECVLYFAIGTFVGALPPYLYSTSLAALAAATTGLIGLAVLRLLRKVGAR